MPSLASPLACVEVEEKQLSFGEISTQAARTMQEQAGYLRLALKGISSYSREGGYSTSRVIVHCGYALVQAQYVEGDFHLPEPDNISAPG